MKKLHIIALLTCLFSFKANAQDDPSYIKNYGNGVYYVEADLAGQLPDIGSRLAQLKQLHPECYVTAVAPINGRFSTIGLVVNCEKRK